MQKKNMKDENEVRKRNIKINNQDKVTHKLKRKTK